MSDAFIGEIRTFAGGFPPTGWAACDGRLLPIAQYSALFSILGTTYGGDGKVTFGLPNLQGNAPMHWGTGPGLTPREIGETLGSTAVTLTSANLPAHTHPVNASSSDATALAPTDGLLAEAPLYADPPYTQALSQGTVSPTGASLPHDNVQPMLVVTFIIALQGIFPPRG